MAFPTSPTNGQIATVNNIVYSWDSTKGAWVRATTNITNQPGNVTVYGNLIPSSNVTYNLGTTTSRFNSLYLSGNTIDLAGATIKTDATTGAIALVPQPTATTPNPTALVISPTGATTTVVTTGGVVSGGDIATASNSATAVSSIMISNVAVANSSYALLDDTAVDTAGGYIVLTGSGFNSNSRVIVGTTNATSTTYVSATQLRAQAPALSAATYPVYVVDSYTGATAIRVNGLTYSTFPAWSTGSTLSNQNSGNSFGVSLSATSDSSITYANTTALPGGTTLASNGYFYGTITVGSQTTYSFDVKATDTENQDTSRTFSVTITVSAPKLFGWGHSVYGVPLAADKSSPTQLGALTDWGGNISLGGQRHALAVKSNGTLWAWGRNVFGALGNNSTTDVSSPVQIGALTTWLNVAAGRYFSLATKTDGTLWAWGFNVYGPTGLLPTSDYKSSPTQVGTLTNWALVGIAGSYSSIATKTDGTLWAWGFNNRGNLGVGDRINRSSPTQIGTDTNWIRLHSNMQTQDIARCHAIKTNGTIWGWGSNGVGQIGDGTIIDRSSPVQVGAGTSWLTVAGGYQHTIATKSDGTLWSWGRNDWNQLGLNDNTNRSSPTQVGALTDWSSATANSAKIACSLASCSVIKTNGTLWVWGRNDYYQLGIPDGNNVASPVQLGSSTNWIKVFGPNYNNTNLGNGDFFVAINDGA